jgi:two-component sensor histidine kinase/CHASE1-domain containing sensor protein
MPIAPSLPFSAADAVARPPEFIARHAGDSPPARGSEPRQGYRAWCLRAALLAVVYFLSGKLGLLLAVPPGYATAIWPPSGFALVGILLLGVRYWPGVWLGSFLVNVGMAFDTSSTAAIVRELAVAGSIGLGASMQAVAGAWLVRRFAGWPTVLIRTREVLSFMGLSGPLGCFIGATWGVGTLGLVGAMPPSAWLVNWATWWVGDTLGVWIFATLGLTALGQPREIWRRRWRTVALPLAAAFVTAVGVYWFVHRAEHARQRTAFGALAQEQASRLMLAMQTNEVLLHGLAGLFGSSDAVTREEFRRYTRPMLDLHHGIEGLTWIPCVPGERRAEFEAAARADGFAEFQFTELSDRGLVRAGEHSLFFPVYYFEARGSAQPALGLDLASEPGRRDALFRARETAVCSATAPIRLVQSRERGVLLFLPVFASDQGDRLLRGLVNCVIPIDRFVRAALDPSAFASLHLRIEDHTGRTPAFVFASAGRHAAARAGREALSWSTDLTIGQRVWRAHFTPTLAYRAAGQSFAGWLVLAGAFLFTSLLGSVLLIITGSVALVEVTVAERTASLTALNATLEKEIVERWRADEALRTSLQEKEVLLREVHHRVKNNMQVINSLLQMQAGYVHDPRDADFFRQCQTRIHAMALVHDRLYRSASLATIDLGAYLADLAQLVARGQSRRGLEVALETDCAAFEVSLDLAIPIGLAATEIVANAFRHAFPGRHTGRLAVRLRQTTGRGIVLQVADDGVGIAADIDPQRARSLGMRLISNLARQARAELRIVRGAGTCFELHFSAAATAHAPAHDDPAGSL